MHGENQVTFGTKLGIIHKIYAHITIAKSITESVEDELSFSEETAREIRTDTVDENTTLTINCTTFDDEELCNRIFFLSS